MYKRGKNSNLKSASSRPLAATILLSLFLLFAYQACSGDGFFSIKSSKGDFNGKASGGSLSSGNGDGYSGKPDGTYYAIAENGECVDPQNPSAPQVEDAIEYRQGQAFRVYENCQPKSPPEPLVNTQANLTWEDYNNRVVLSDRLIYEHRNNLPQPAAAEKYVDMFCRGEIKARQRRFEFRLYDSYEFEYEDEQEFEGSFSYESETSLNRQAQRKSGGIFDDDADYFVEEADTKVIDITLRTNSGWQAYRSSARSQLTAEIVFVTKKINGQPDVRLVSEFPVNGHRRFNERYYSLDRHMIYSPDSFELHAQFDGSSTWHGFFAGRIDYEEIWAELDCRPLPSF